MTHKLNLGRIVDAIPRSGLLYRFCRRYVAHYNGENNSDIRTNGEFRWLRQVIPQCDIVFDVGANRGDWTELALVINPDVQVHCFEPSAETFRHLEARSFPNEQVLLNRFGLSASSGEMTLHSYSVGTGLSSLYSRAGLDNSSTSAEQIRLVTMDDYCQLRGIEKIDLLKLDVEGHELKVLEGAARLLADNCVRRIQFEYGGTYIDARVLLKDMFELLTAYGYQLSKVYPHELRPAARYTQAFENFQYQNWMAVK